MKFNFSLIIYIALGVISLQAALLDHTGKPYKEIVVATDATDSVQLAAKEMQEFCHKICAANLKIVHVATQFPVIFIGESSGLKKRGLSAEKLPREGYLIKTGADYLAILGQDYKGRVLLGPINPWRSVEAYNSKLKLAAFGDAGTLTGVYEFLRQIGKVRFYLPGKLGTVITSVPNLTVPKLTISGAPKVNYRYPWFSMFEHSPESALWAHRVGFGGKAPVMIMHSYREFQKYRDSNPEYFALADGKRAFGSECVADGHGHLCLTNPDVIKQWADDIIAYFEAHPDVDVYPLSPNDGLTRICECQNCQAELRPAAPKGGKFSYHIWNFTGKVAALVSKRFPNKYVGCLAYEHYQSPPPEITYLPNVAIMFCVRRSLLANSGTSSRIHAEIEAWSGKVDRFYLWSYYLDHWLPWTNLPIVFIDTIEKELKYLFRNPKFSGEFIEAEGQHHTEYNQMPTPGMQHLNLYVTARLYWNPQLELATLIDEYCNLFYGPAAAPMKSFWLTAQQQRSAFVAKNPKCTPEEVFTPILITKLNGFLNQALETTPVASVYRNRVELIRKEFSIGAKRLTRLENIGIQKLDLPLMNRKKTFAKIKPVKFFGKNGESYTPSTWLYAGYDRQYLYFKFICFEPEIAKIRKKITSNDDGTIWEDDSIEIYICPDESKRAKCYQLVINVNGALFDAKVLNPAARDPLWNSNAKINVEKQANRWVVEVRLPFASIGINDPNFTGNLAVNFYRNRSVGAKATASCWSPTGARAHYFPDKFGVLKLKK